VSIMYSAENRDVSMHIELRGQTISPADPAPTAETEGTTMLRKLAAPSSSVAR